MNRNFSLLIAIIVFVGALLVFERTEVDISFQDLFYSHERHEWLVHKSQRLPRFLFYHGPKIALIGYGVWLLISAIVPKSWPTRPFLSRRTLREICYLIVCLGLFPALIGTLKSISGLHCPSELTRYDGEHPYRKLLSERPADSNQCGDCFPAGHASGGFALIAIWFANRTRRTKQAGLALGLCAGWLMGGYQMLNGSHFLSHTVVTMLLAWIYTLVVAMLFRLPTTQNLFTPNKLRSFQSSELVSGPRDFVQN